MYVNFHTAVDDQAHHIFQAGCEGALPLLPQFVQEELVSRGKVREPHQTAEKFFDPNHRSLHKACSGLGNLDGRGKTGNM